MRIGEPARNHGVTDDDIRYAVRVVGCRREMGENLTMLTGPAAAGSLLEIGVLDLEADDSLAIHAMALRPQFSRFLR